MNQLDNAANRKLYLIGQLVTHKLVGKNSSDRLMTKPLAELENFAKVSGIVAPWLKEERARDAVQSAINMYRTDSGEPKPTKPVTDRSAVRSTMARLNRELARGTAPAARQDTQDPVMFARRLQDARGRR